MEIRLASLGSADAEGTVVVIDVFRAFTVAAVAFAQGARRIIMVGSLEEALALRAQGRGERCMGEREGRKPEGFDFGNSPAELAAADLTGLTLVQTTTNGTTGIAAARRAERIYTGAFVNAEATVEAIRRRAPALVTLVAMGRHGRVRADEDELCALYLRCRLEGRRPDREALRSLLATMPPPADERLVAAGDYDPADREYAARIDWLPLAIRVRSEGGLLVAEPERGGPMPME
jgi:2-phosphosulfolactate phosphatase